MTKKQKRVMDVLRNRPCNRYQMAAALFGKKNQYGIFASRAAGMLYALKKKGWVKNSIKQEGLVWELTSRGVSTLDPHHI